jgi:hypothetical protein
VDDTPQHKVSPIGTCNVGQDTCDGEGVNHKSFGIVKNNFQLRLDSSLTILNLLINTAIYNFMDYSNCPDKVFMTGQMQKMHGFYFDHRSMTRPCDHNEYQIDLDLKFDSHPDKYALEYITWGTLARGSYQPIESRKIQPTGYIGKQVIGHRCVPHHAM